MIIGRIRCEPAVVRNVTVSVEYFLLISQTSGTIWLICEQPRVPQLSRAHLLSSRVHIAARHCRPLKNLSVSKGYFHKMKSHRKYRIYLPFRPPHCLLLNLNLRK
jgi:hypothetical protein